MVFVIIDPKAGPTLGDLMDVPVHVWLVSLIVAMVLVGGPIWWFTDQQNRFFKCLDAVYPITWADYRVSMFADIPNCKERLK